jgi:hypothetical protein
VADTLSKILYKAKISRYIKKLGNFEGDNLINFNFADNTLIFLNVDTKMIDALKLLLIGYEHLTCLKINFIKSEMVPLNLQINSSYANILGCKISSFSITYLGMPLHRK